MPMRKVPAKSPGKKTTAKKTTAKKVAAKRAATQKLATGPPKAGRAVSAADRVEEQLARYRSMRDFGVTAEPSGSAEARPSDEPGALPFCIQKHAASHLHYDFRLGWNGVLKSWACAKGPSLNVKDRRLAVQVEDHPIEYGGFEGTIPQGQYGGGTVMLWDQGTWEAQAESADVDAALRDGHLKFVLHGSKLQGKWALIRMAPRPKETKPNWLLIKEHDEYERPPGAPAITEEAPDSVITGRSLEQIAASEDHVWQSNRPEKTAQSRVRVGSRAKRGSGAVPLDGAVDRLPREHQPTFLQPQLAQETQAPPEGPAWLHELKLDGYRMQAKKAGATVQMLTRSGLDWTARMKAIADELVKLPVDSVTLDGEVVVLAPDGTTNFADLQAAFQENARHPLTYFCFDLLHLNGRNPRNLGLLERKQLLAQVLQSTDPGQVQISEHIISNGLAMFHKACELRAEGIVSKRTDAPYSGSRNAAWLKSKCLHEQEFAIAGYTLPGKGNAGGPGIGALLLAYYDDAGEELIYAGRTGTGFTQKFAAELRKRLAKLESKTTPLKNLSADARRGAIWVKPTLVAQVRFATWTADLQVRQAAFLGLREDKPADEIRRETAAPTPKGGKKAGPSEALKAGGGSTAKTAAGRPAGAQTTAERTASGRTAASQSLAHPPVRLTHPAKILDEESRLSKQQLADFYWAIAGRMLPHIANRPLSLVRCPEGSEKPCFFQKHVNQMLPPGVGSVAVADKKGVVEPYITLNNAEALAGLAQMGVLEVHPWGSQNQTLEQPDRITIDLDPDEALPWSTLTAAAEDVRRRLKKLHLESWVKTTGGKGLHVVIPIVAEHEWPAIKEWARQFVLAMERDNPRLYLSKMTKAARVGKIYLDYLRNERGATAVAPYSPRARRGAPVSVPLAWAELQTAERPRFTVANFPDWASRLKKKDVWAKLLESKQRLRPAL